MSPELRQLRESFADRIKRNKCIVSFFSSGTLCTERVRLVHESASVQTNKQTSVGLGTSFSMFCQMPHYSIIKESDVLIVGGKGWKVGPVDELTASCGVYGKRAPLTRIETLGATKNIVSLKIGSIVGIVVGNNITVTVPAGTDVTSVTPTINHRGKMISPTTAQDFTNPVMYTVTAEDLTTQNYIITVVTE